MPAFLNHLNKVSEECFLIRILVFYFYDINQIKSKSMNTKTIV